MKRSVALTFADKRIYATRHRWTAKRWFRHDSLVCGAEYARWHVAFGRLELGLVRASNLRKKDA